MRRMETAKKSGGQPESEGELRGVWIVGNVEVIKDAEGTREDHT